jgi:hypothetical protein
MPYINPFDQFGVVEVSEAINVLPNKYGRIQELGIFTEKGVTTDKIAVEEKNGSLVLLPLNVRGGPGSQGKVDKRKLRTFAIPKIEENDHIEAEEANGVRAFGEQAPVMATQMLNDKLETLRQKHEITHEYLRAGALSGVIKDADGSTHLNLFTEFGIAEKTVDFVLGTGTTKVANKCREVVRWVEENLKGDSMTGVRCLVSPEFYDKLITHASVEAAYANYAAAADRLGGDLRRGFTFGGITFEEYVGQAVDKDGNVRKFITAGDGRAYPAGTAQTFRKFIAPADFNETVNKLGQKYYGKVVPAKFERGYDIHTQSNVLPICMRPAVLVRVFSSN